MRITSGISPSFLGLSRSSRWVTHVLLTRSRLCPRASPGSSLHLHVLSTPPAFVLSQDQTLREVNYWPLTRRPAAVIEVRLDCMRHRVDRDASVRRVNSYLRARWRARNHSPRHHSFDVMTV